MIMVPGYRKNNNISTDVLSLAAQVEWTVAVEKKKAPRLGQLFTNTHHGVAHLHTHSHTHTRHSSSLIVSVRVSGWSLVANVL